MKENKTTENTEWTRDPTTSLIIGSAKVKVGLLMNFNAIPLKHGIQRFRL